MIRKRTIGALAALGAFTAAASLLSGSSVANADEITELRANQELLQRRLDQLAQAPIVAPGGLYPPSGGGPANVQMMGGSFPRSFLIPGTDTSIRVGGNIYMEMMYYINGLAAPLHQDNQGATGNAPATVLSKSGVARTRSDNWLEFTPKRSNIAVETRTPTAWGEARTFIEFDFNDTSGLANRPFAVSDNLSLRLRYAYGTIGPWLGGQANSNFADPDADMEVASNGNLVGGPGHARIPQLRYTAPLAPWGFLGALSVSVEQPETEVISPGTGVCGSQICAGTNILKGPAPDITAAWYIPQPWGHVDFSAVLRPTLYIEDGTGAIDRHYMGWGVHFGGDVKPRWFGWDRDYFTWHALVGQAMGPYANIATNAGFGLSSNFGAVNGVNGYFGPTVTAANALFKPTTTFGANTSYQHRWTPNLRSNIGVGILHEDVNTMRGAVCAGGSSAAAINARQTGAAGCNTNTEVVTAAANLFWDIVPFASVGIEYFWAHRLTVGGQRGDANSIQTQFRVRF